MNWKEKLMLKALKAYLTRERVIGLAQHAATWFAGWLISKGIIDQSVIPVITGGCVGIVTIVFSVLTGGKETPAQSWQGIARHVLSMIAAIAVFKGWVDSDTANAWIAAILGTLAGIWSLQAPEKAEATERREYRKKHKI